MTVAIAAAPTAISFGPTNAERLEQLARLKRAVLGTRAAKSAALRGGGLGNLVALLDVDTNSPECEASLAVSAEAANALAALSMPTLDAIAALLDSKAHHAVSRILAKTFESIQLRRESGTPLVCGPRVLEAHLRALKALYTDLVKVVGPREWGTDVVGASIDVAERRDAESLWTWSEVQERKAADAKGKGKEADVALGGVASLDLLVLQQAADDALQQLFALRQLATTPGVGSSTAGGARRGVEQTATLAQLLALLRWAADPLSSSDLSLQHRQRYLELICAFLAGTVRRPEQRAAVLAGVEGVTTMRALYGLAYTGSDKARLSGLGLDSNEDQDRFGPLAALAQSASPSVRLAAASLCAVLSKTLYPASRGASPPPSLGSTPTSALLDLVEKERTLRAQAAFILAYLVADQPDLQARCVAAKCFQTFSEILKEPILGEHPYPTRDSVEEDARVREGIFLCMASIAALSEYHRQLILEYHLLAPILHGLSYPSVGVRAAACHCVRALSRSVNVLRTELVECHAAGPLVSLLREDENEVVKITATAAIANLLLDFSPMRSVLVDAGCVPRMCQLVLKSSSPALRTNAMWAIKNATYQSAADFKRVVLACLTWDDLANLITSPDASTVELALSILRNITCVTNNEAINGLGADEMGEDRLLGLLEQRIAAGMGLVGAPVQGERSGVSLVEQALYCLNNIATSSESAQLAIASRTSLLRCVFSFLDSRHLSLRVASLWVLHNLAYRTRASYATPASSLPYPASSRRPHEIVDKLRAMGLDGRLRVLERDPELDVRERVRDLKEALVG
ncbi:hypothetical protein Rhopal_000859-T1 [Rhodotorula paludigena]|uniref:Armadillo repeat-containing protein 8 n=1 Tax=Rhodotorula paludigena TaxID=86838 RepID=A0AAV5GEX9_9BASI|nr:hypothetical protein Rhopal_000859-T1 [Rhodotorula paludigena]